MDLNPDNYTNLDDESKFVLLNIKTHETVHFLYTYYKKDKKIIDRLVDILDRMVEINN